MIKYILPASILASILVYIMPISAYTNINDTNDKYNILVMPTDIKTPTKTKQNNINKQRLSKLIQTYLIFSGIKVNPYKYSVETLNLIKKKNIHYKDIPKHLKKLAKINYILLSKLNTLNQYYIISVELINVQTGKIVFVDKHKVFNPSNKPFFMPNPSDTYIQNTSVFPLINGICKKIVNFIKYKGKTIKPKKDKKKELLQIMFVIDNSPVIQHKLIYIKNYLRKFTESIRKKYKKIKIEISVITGKNPLPFVDNIIKVENYINKHIKKLEVDNRNFRSRLYAGLISKEWSIYDTDHRVIFIITDDPFKRRVNLDEKHKILMLPIMFYNIDKKYKQNTNNKNNITQVKNIIYKELAKYINSYNITAKKQLDQLISNIKNTNIKTYYNEWDNISTQLRVIHGINYIIDGTLEKKDNKYKLSIYIKDIKKNKTLYSIHRYNNNISSIIKDTEYIKYNVMKFYKNLLATNENQIIENIRKTDFSNLIQLAKSKSINVYTLAYTNINKELKNILKRMSQLMGGDYINIKYNISARLNNNQQANFLYDNKTLYEYKPNKPNNKILATNINKLEDIKPILINSGYNINQNTKLSFQLTGIFDTINSKIQNSNNNNNHKKQFILKSDNYFYPFTSTGLKEKEIRKLNNIIKQNKEIIIASPIIPSLPYKVNYKENNRIINKLIKFTLSPHKLKILLPEEHNNISPLLKVKIEKLNKKPYFFNNIGLIQNQKLWLIKGTLTNTTE